MCHIITATGDRFIFLPGKGRRKFWVAQSLSLVMRWEAEICSLPLADGNISVKWGFIHGRLISVSCENSSMVNIVEWEFYLVLKAHELGERLGRGGGNQAYSNHTFDNRLWGRLFGLARLSLRTLFPGIVKQVCLYYLCMCVCISVCVHACCPRVFVGKAIIYKNTSYAKHLLSTLKTPHPLISLSLYWLLRLWSPGTSQICDFV